MEKRAQLIARYERLADVTGYASFIRSAAIVASMPLGILRKLSTAHEEVLDAFEARDGIDRGLRTGVALG